MNTAIRIEAGKIGVYVLQGSAGATKLAIYDNGHELYQSASLFGSLDNGNTFEPLSAEFMRKLSSTRTDMLLRIDASQLQAGIVYEVNSIDTDTMLSNVVELSNSIDHFYYDATKRCYDEHDLRKVVADNIHQLSQAAQDNAAWPIVYYPARTLTAIDVLNAYELKSITESKEVAVFFPHRKMIGQLDFDQFGLQYDELTTIHVLADEFHRVFADEYARPGKLDIIYIAFLDQYFEVSDVNDIKTPLNTILYYECTLRIVSDRKTVAKDTDILSLEGLIDGNDQAAEFEFKDEQPESTNTNQQFYTFAKHTWSYQTFEQAIEYEIRPIDNAVYGIAWSRRKLRWLKFKCIDNVVQTAELTSKDFVTGQAANGTYDANAFANDAFATGGADKFYFAKLAVFDEPLSVFDEQMYYSSPKFPRLLQPTVLYEYQTAI